MITVLVSILLFESVDVSNTRDSTIQQIMDRELSYPTIVALT